MVMGKISSKEQKEGSGHGWLYVRDSLILIIKVGLW